MKTTVKLRTTNVFGYFSGVITQFEHVKFKFSNYTMLYVHLFGFQITHCVKQRTTCQRTNYHVTTNYSEYLPRLELLWSHDIHAVKKHNFFA